MITSSYILKMIFIFMPDIIEIGNHLHPCSNWKWLSTQTSQADNQSHGSQGAPGTQDIIQQKDGDDDIIIHDNNDDTI